MRNLCRSSIAVNSSSASGLTRPSIASARSAVLSRFCCSSRTNGTGSGAISSSATSPKNGTRCLRAVVVDQPVGVHAELLERTLLELLDPHLLLGARHLVAVHGVDQLVVLAPQVTQRGAGCQQLLLALLSRLLDRGARVGRLHHAPLQPHQHEGRPRR